MAFWNAPMDQPDHAARACATALDMVQRLHELRAQWSDHRNYWSCLRTQVGDRDRLIEDFNAEVQRA